MREKKPDDDIEWINLHKGMAVDEIGKLPQGLSIRDLMPQASDFADTAALIMELDLVITTDTAVAHLAGALGAPTLTLLDAAPDCRWLLKRDDCPWYPTMRLIQRYSSFPDSANVMPMANAALACTDGNESPPLRH